MTGFLGVAFIVAVLIIAALGFAVVTFVCLLAGKGNWAAIWLAGAAVSTVLVLLTFREALV